MPSQSARNGILVRGVGDVGSAVAHVLFRAGQRVVLHDVARPAYSRRGMAFTDAVFENKANLSGVIAKHARQPEFLQHMFDCGRAIPVLTDSFDRVLAQLKPGVLIDARMRKRHMPEAQIHCAPLTIGLGPNFVAGATTHLVVETSWGDALGRVISAGQASPLAGEPRLLGGAGRERFVYAPQAGLFVTARAIGDSISARSVVGDIDGVHVLAPLSGRLRGLTHSGVAVTIGTKIVEMDPRHEDAQIFGLGERPARIAAAVLAAIH